MRIILDTNVLVSGLRSNRGASFKLLSLIGSDHFQTVISVAVFLEYEEVLLRENILNANDVDTLLLYLYKVSHKQSIFFLYRPNSGDPKDEMFFDLAIASQADYLVTYNLKDYKNASQYGFKVIAPKELLEKLGENHEYTQH